MYTGAGTQARPSIEAIYLSLFTEDSPMLSLFRAICAATAVYLTLFALNAAHGQDADALRKQLAEIEAKLAALQAFPGYYDAAAQAVKERKPLVFFYGTGYPRKVAGCVVGRQDYGVVPGLESEAGKIVVAVLAGDWLTWRASLPADATDADIKAAFAPRQVQALPAPFVSQPPVDADGNSLLPVGAIEAMDELNAQRARKGIPPFIRDDGLTIAAGRAAAFRAARFMAGHTASDFAYVPAGSHADAAGCGAWAVGTVTTDGWTFGTCCADDRGYRFGGAAWVMGSDGRRYMHLYVRR